MKDSFFYPPPDKIARIAMVYVRKDGKLVPAPATILGGDPAKYRQGAVFPAPGWGLYSTAEDLLHLYRMMLNNGVYEGRRYLSPFSVHLMTEPHTTGIHPVGWMRGSRLRAGLGSGHRSARRTRRPYQRNLRTRRRIRHAGLDRP